MLKKIIPIVLIFIIIIIRLLYINSYKKEYYKELLDNKTNNYVYGKTAPRGRIIDRNGKILVDNKGIKTVYYNKIKKISNKEELEIANALANILDINLNSNSYKRYWLMLNNNGDSLITDEEKELYKLRKISSNDIKKLKYDRIGEKEINSLTYLDKKIATIYELMNNGYSYDKKEIVRGISDDVYSRLVESNIKGITTELSWERVYNYGDILKDVFGTIGKIPKDEKEEYLKNGYELDDIVGISYLEKYYDEYLKGTKDLYKVNSDNTLTLVKKGSNGKDLILSIDIEVQKELEKIIENNIINAKKRKNTDYFNEAYSIVGMPLTGEIIAFSGRKLISDYHNPVFQNANINLITSSFTVGSVVKMGTISAGYKNKVIDIGSSVTDGCVKLYQVPIKCSYKKLGKINDLTAISKSSNYYQFKIALALAGEKYKYNMKLNTDITDFNKFRSIYNEYGLGSITGIDLPNEKTGIIGKNTSSDLLLNLSIGQYDTYTPVELFQYVNTIASGGIKKSPQLMKEIKDSNYAKQNDYKVIGKVSLDNKYIERIKEAMHLATTSGTARNYIDKKYNPAGKTGTSETFIDTNKDNIMDTKTTSIAFVGFAPVENPQYSIVVLAPNIYVSKSYNYSKVYITRYISRDITKFLFEK